MDIAFRVDASHQIGTGHLMRCLTLADALHEREANIWFISRYMPDHLQKMIEDRGYAFHGMPDVTIESDNRLTHSRWLGTSQQADATATLNCLPGRTWDWLIVDHYALDSHWESSVRACAKRIMVIDDLADRVHDCDVLLDQNFYSDMHDRYREKVAKDCLLLLGPVYALLKPDFAALRERTVVRNGKVEKILIFFGGIDAANYTQQAIIALDGIDNFDVDVVIGTQHAQQAQIKADCIKRGYTCHVQTSRMAELMSAADLMIGAGGATTWERCCMGVPTLAISVAENQDRQISDAARAGLLYAPKLQGSAVIDLVLHVKALILNPALRSLLSSNGMKQVDGRGVARVVSRLGANRIAIRKAAVEDSHNLLEWRNHPAIRSVSRNEQVIVWEDHQRWFNSVLNDPDRCLLIGMINGSPIGVVRYDCDNGTAEVSIYLVPENLSVGYGTELLQQAEKWLLANRQDVRMISAHVLDHNPKSAKLFVNSGYDLEPSCLIKRLTR